MTYLTKDQQNRLKAVGRKADHPDCGKPNTALDDLLDQLRMETPLAFLKEEELRYRVFMIKPKDNKTLCRGFNFNSIKEVQ